MINYMKRYHSTFYMPQSASAQKTIIVKYLTISCIYLLAQIWLIFARRLYWCGSFLFYYYFLEVSE